jgi:hypothetical protein
MGRQVGTAFEKRDPAARRYRVKPWPIRVCIPLAAVVVIAALLHSHESAYVPLVVLAATAWVWLAERCGIYVTDWGIQSVMARRENSFRHPWSAISAFNIVDVGSLTAIVVSLDDGTRKPLPSTKVWSWAAWDRRALQQICQGLQHELATAGHASTIDNPLTTA